jgi:uncharacterized protein (DUF1800 family)
MLRSRHFFSEHAYRQRVKSPVEYVAGVVRAVRPSAAPRELVQPLEAMGQSLFAPPNVKGWPGGKTWLNSATVLARQNFAQTMLGEMSPPAPNQTANQGEVVETVVEGLAVPADQKAVSAPSPSEDLVNLVTRERATEPAAAVNLLADLLLQSDISDETRAKLTAFVAEGKPEKAAWQQRVHEAAHALLTLPEYTLA